MIAAAVTAIVGPPRGDRDVIDLGCGTGLSGVALRPFARHLAGVDLSPRMVARAGTRGLYDRLDVGDLADALAASEGRWDLCVAADVLVYVGALDATMAAVAKALRPSGLFAFTVERGQGADVELGPARRFRHGEAHVRRTADAAGLAVVSLEPCVPRLDRGDPVDGLVAVLRLSR
jgi:predicted TPR repeat methyltransferase